MENKKKNILMLVAAFVVGGIVVGALAFGSGTLLQGKFGFPLPGDSQFPPQKPQTGCTLNACDVLNDVQAVNARVSEVQSMLEGYMNSTNSNINNFATTFTAVNNRLDSLENTLNWLVPYTTDNFTDVYNQLSALQ